MSDKTFNRATVYQNGLGGYRSQRVRGLIIREGVRYAQFDAAVQLTFTPKGKRKARRQHLTDELSLVVVEGWGAPEYDVDSMRATGPMTSQSRHLACSPEWQGEFDAWLAAQSLTVAADYRGQTVESRFA